MGKPYSIDLVIFDLTVLEYALSEKNIFSMIVALKKNNRLILSDSPS